MKKIETVKSSVLFNDIINKGYKVSNSYFVICRSKNNNGTNFGVAVGKKVGNAVIRNKIKRQIRRIIDNNKNLFKNNTNYIIIGKKDCLSASFEAMNESMKNILTKEKNDEK